MSDVLEVKVLKDMPVPVISNNGWALDILTPRDLYVGTGKEFILDSLLQVKIPSNAMGLVSSKLKGDFSIVKGEIVHPSHEGSLELVLKYNGVAMQERIPKGTAICQLVLTPIFNLEDKIIITQDV